MKIPNTCSYQLVRMGLIDFFSDQMFEEEDDFVMDWQMLVRISAIFGEPINPTMVFRGIPFFGKDKRVDFNEFASICLNKVAVADRTFVFWYHRDFIETLEKTQNGTFVLYSKLDNNMMSAICSVGNDNLRGKILQEARSRYPENTDDFESIRALLVFLHGREEYADNEDLIVWSMYIFRTATLDEGEAALSNTVLHNILYLCIPFDNQYVLNGFQKFVSQSDNESQDPELFFSLSRKEELLSLMKYCIEFDAFISLKFMLKECLANQVLFVEEDARILLDYSGSTNWVRLVGLLTLDGRMVLDASADYSNFNDYYVNLALIEAIRDGDSELIKALIENGKASPDFLLNSRIGCLSLSVLMDSLEIVKYFLDRGATADCPNANLLMSAIANSKLEVFNYLCPPGSENAIVDVYVVDPITKMTALSHACALNTSDTSHIFVDRVFSLLGQSYSNINLLSLNNWTPLDYAFSHGNSETIAKLLKLGAKRYINLASPNVDSAAPLGHVDTAITDAPVATLDASSTVAAPIVEGARQKRSPSPASLNEEPAKSLKLGNYICLTFPFISLLIRSSCSSC